VIILVGNKTDLQEDREVTFLEASRFAQENDLMFLETSAKNGENVEEVFMKCAKTILNKIDSGVIRPDDMGSGIQVGTPKKKRAPPSPGNNSGVSGAEDGDTNDGCPC